MHRTQMLLLLRHAGSQLLCLPLTCRRRCLRNSSASLFLKRQKGVFAPPVLPSARLLTRRRRSCSDALCGNSLAMLRLRPYIARAPAALAFRPAGVNCSTLSGLLVHQRAGGDFAVHQLAELPLGTLPLRQIALSPGTTCRLANVVLHVKLTSSTQARLPL